VGVRVVWVVLVLLLAPLVVVDGGVGGRAVSGRCGGEPQGLADVDADLLLAAAARLDVKAVLLDEHTQLRHLHRRQLHLCTLELICNAIITLPLLICRVNGGRLLLLLVVHRGLDGHGGHLSDIRGRVCLGRRLRRCGDGELSLECIPVDGDLVGMLLVVHLGEPNSVDRGVSACGQVGVVVDMLPCALRRLQQRRAGGVRRARHLQLPMGMLA